MKEDALAFKDQFQEISFGDPLLTTEKDNRQVIEALGREFGHIPTDEAVVLMGHGTSHYANTTYAALDYTMKLQFLPGHSGSLPFYGNSAENASEIPAGESTSGAFHDRSRGPCAKRYGW